LISGLGARAPSEPPWPLPQWQERSQKFWRSENFFFIEKLEILNNFSAWANSAPWLRHCPGVTRGYTEQPGIFRGGLNCFVWRGKFRGVGVFLKKP